MDSHLPQSPPKSPKPPKPKKPPKPPKPPMNKNQKISLLVCVFSAVVFLISGIVTSSSGYMSGLKALFYNFQGPIENISYIYNYIGIIALGSTVTSLVAYFMFKDGKGDQL